MFWRKKRPTVQEIIDIIKNDLKGDILQEIQDHERAMQFMCRAQQELGGEIEFWHGYTTGSGNLIEYRLKIDEKSISMKSLEDLIPLYET